MITEAKRAYFREYRLKNSERIRAQRAARREEILAIQKEWREKNKERINAKRRATYPANRERHLAAAKAHYAKNADRIKLREQLRRYDITLEQFNAMRAAQSNQCAICRQPFTLTPHIDHDHDTKVVRGLLCAQCNTAIGLLGDSARTAFNAATYLQSHGK